jgi:undecaprenyl-phosphate 4-deoxy-4-formamido-L-arabinose transferase
MASSRSDWVITMDEDGQQHPADIAALLDTALTHGSQLVYATPKNAPPHGLLRNTLSRIAKVFFVYALGNRSFGSFNSFRLINGEIARSLAAYCGNNVFLDVALSWVVSRVHHTPVLLRPEMGRPSGYSIRSLVRHFMKLVLTSGTRPLRFIMMIGLLSMILAIAITGYALWAKFHLQVPVQGWTSLVIVVSFFSGCILFSLGVISEYLAVALNIAMGRPLYLITSKPTRRNT